MYNENGPPEGQVEVKSEPTELETMLSLVDDFAKKMKEKLTYKAECGYSNGLNPNRREYIFKDLVMHTHKAPLGDNQEIDIANYAMMLWATRLVNEEQNHERG